MFRETKIDHQKPAPINEVITCYNLYNWSYHPTGGLFPFVSLQHGPLLFSCKWKNIVPKKWPHELVAGVYSPTKQGL